MKIPMKDEMIRDLYKIIGRLGSIAEIHYSYMNDCIDAGMWEREQVLQWAKHFAEDPWRIQNKEFRTVAHFLRAPERWMDSKKGDDAWTQ